MNWKPLVKRWLARRGYELRRRERIGEVVRGIRHETVIPRATYAPWATDAAFQAVYSAIKPYTALDIYRCYGLWGAVREAVKLGPGAIVEVGTWKGGAGVLMAARAKGLTPAFGYRDTYLCDTFEGVVKAGPQDPEYRGGEFGDASREDVAQLADVMNVRCNILAGVFPEETGDQIAGTIAVAHIDVDTYQSCIDAFNFIVGRMRAGGIVVFDDYGFLGTEGIIRAVGELRQRGGMAWTHSLSGQAVAVKVAS